MSQMLGCFFYKIPLPAFLREDSAFNECIAFELKFGRKIFSVLYRSPAFKDSSPEFYTSLSNIWNFYYKIKAENPYATFLQQILVHIFSFDGDTNINKNLEGRETDDLFFMKS